jgi:hypothetical protein
MTESAEGRMYLRWGCGCREVKELREREDDIRERVVRAVR